VDPPLSEIHDVTPQPAGDIWGVVYEPANSTVYYGTLGGTVLEYPTALWPTLNGTDTIAGGSFYQGFIYLNRIYFLSLEAPDTVVYYWATAGEGSATVPTSTTTTDTTTTATTTTTPTTTTATTQTTTTATTSTSTR